MIYVEENARGELVRVEMAPFDGMTGNMAVADARVHNWLAREEVRARLARLRDSDLELIRVLEDLVGVLVDRGVIRYTDLPVAAQRKLQQRAEARAELGSLGGLLGDEDDQHLL
jgi:transposase